MEERTILSIWRQRGRDYQMKGMEGKRSEKVADLIQKEISEMLVKRSKDPRIGFVTITRVTVSEDCRMAKSLFQRGRVPDEEGEIDARAQQCERICPEGVGPKDPTEIYP